MSFTDFELKIKVSTLNISTQQCMDTAVFPFSYRCWLNPIPFYASFLAPVAIIILINFIVFFLVLRQLLGASTKNINKTDSTKTSSRLRGAVTLVIMLGLTWVFAILAIDGGAPVFQYLFTVFNSLQGLFIFVFHCLLKTDAQKAWKRACCAGDKEKDSRTSKGKSICATILLSRLKKRALELIVTYGYLRLLHETYKIKKNQ